MIKIFIFFPNQNVLLEITHVVYGTTIVRNSFEMFCKAISSRMFQICDIAAALSITPTVIDNYCK